MHSKSKISAALARGEFREHGELLQWLTLIDLTERKPIKQLFDGHHRRVGKGLFP